MPFKCPDDACTVHILNVHADLNAHSFHCVAAQPATDTLLAAALWCWSVLMELIQYASAVILWCAPLAALTG